MTTHHGVETKASPRHQIILALVDLALPENSHHNSTEIVEGISRATLLLQAASQCKTSLSCNYLCSSNAVVNMADIKGLQRNCELALDCCQAARIYF